MALTDNLRAAYKLNDTSDGTANGYNLTNTGTVTFAAGKVGNAAQFGSNNSSKKLSIGSALGIGSSDDITISYWAKDANNLAQSQGIELVYASGTKRIRVFRDAVNGRWALYANSGNAFSAVGDGLANNTWRHLFVTLTGGTATLYVNSVSTLSLSPGAATAFGDGLNLGFSQEGIYTSGDVDSLYIWNSALDATDRASMYNAGNGAEPSVYALSAAQTSYSLTGQTLNMSLGRFLTAVRATFALSGIALLLYIGKTLIAEVVSFVLTGKNALLGGMYVTKYDGQHNSYSDTHTAQGDVYHDKLTQSGTIYTNKIT